MAVGGPLSEERFSVTVVHTPEVFAGAPFAQYWKVSNGEPEVAVAPAVGV